MGAVVDDDVLGQFGYGIDYSLVLVEIDSLLTVISELHSLSDVEMTAVRSDQSLEHLDECGFSRTVPADYADFLITGEHITEIVKDPLVAEAFRHVVRLEYLGTDI